MAKVSTHLFGMPAGKIGNRMSADVRILLEFFHLQEVLAELTVTCFIRYDKCCQSLSFSDDEHVIT